MTEMRCHGKRQALILEDGTIEIKCDSRVCGAGPGITVLHRYDPRTGKQVGTEVFRTPRLRKEGQGDVQSTAHQHPVRHS